MDAVLIEKLATFTRAGRRHMVAAAALEPVLLRHCATFTLGNLCKVLRPAQTLRAVVSARAF